MQSEAIKKKQMHSKECMRGFETMKDLQLLPVQSEVLCLCLYMYETMN